MGSKETEEPGTEGFKCQKIGAETVQFALLSFSFFF